MHLFVLFFLCFVFLVFCINKRTSCVPSVLWVAPASLSREPCLGLPYLNSWKALRPELSQCFDYNSGPFGKATTELCYPFYLISCLEWLLAAIGRKECASFIILWLVSSHLCVVKILWVQGNEPSSSTYEKCLRTPMVICNTATLWPCVLPLKHGCGHRVNPILLSHRPLEQGTAWKPRPTD